MGHSSDCMTCHGMENFTGTLGNGQVVNLSIDPAVASTNLHTRLGECSVCHKDFDGYPHPNTKEAACSQCHFQEEISPTVSAKLPFEDARELAAAMNVRCYTCHQPVYVQFTGGSHAKILNSGNLSAPVCSDCHGSHTIQPVALTDTSTYCIVCHGATYNSFMSSVHGTQLVKQNPADAPKCSDCHGSHTLNGPTNTSFLKKSVAACVKCHQDKAMMDRYGLSADMFDEKVDNYHNVGIEMVDRTDLNVVGSTPVCVDCHGDHSIRKSDDPGSAVSSAALLGTCLKCHAGETGFAVSGSAHLATASAGVKGAGIVRTIYQYLIPLSAGLLLGYIALDVRKSRSDRKSNPQSHE